MPYSPCNWEEWIAQKDIYTEFHYSGSFMRLSISLNLDSVVQPRKWDGFGLPCGSLRR